MNVRIASTVFALFLCLLVVPVGWGANIAPPAEKGPRAATVTVSAPGEWIVGTRLWLAVTVSNTSSKTIRGPLEENRPLSFDGYYYAVKSAAGKTTTLRGDKVPLFDQNAAAEQRGFLLPPPQMSIPPGGSVRLLFAIPWPLGRAVRPGKCEVTLVIADPSRWIPVGPNTITASEFKLGEVGRATVRLTVRNATPEEAEGLAAIGEGSGELYLRERSEILDRLEISAALKKNTGLGFEHALYRLCSKEGKLGQADEVRLGADLPAMFAPELALLKCGILKAKKLTDRAARLARGTLAKHPGLKFRIERASRGRGIIAALIQERALNSAARRKRAPAKKAPAPVELSVSTTAHWVQRGAPYPVALTITNRSWQEVFGGPQEGAVVPFEFSGGYAYCLTSVADGKRFATSIFSRKQTEPTPARPGPKRVSPPGKLEVKGRSSVRVLTWLVLPVLPKPGRYHLTVWLVDEHARPTGPWTSTVLTVRKHTPTESRIFRHLFRIRPGRTFSQALTESKELAREKIPSELASSVGFRLLLSGLAFGPKPLAEVDLKSLDLPGAELLKPELSVLRHEILLAKKQVQEAEKVRRETLREYPEIQWLFDRGKAEGGLIGSLRKMRPEAPAEKPKPDRIDPAAKPADPKPKESRPTAPRPKATDTRPAPRKRDQLGLDAFVVGGLIERMPKLRLSAERKARIAEFVDKFEKDLDARAKVDGETDRIKEYRLLIIRVRPLLRR